MSGRESGFRPDIEGLRAVAVGSVLLYHAGLAWVPGGYVGVDVFFVLSGFLITSLMVRDVERHGRLRLADFWARRARRLLPASTLVLAFSAVVAVVCLPEANRRVFGGDIVAAALYVVNWRLGTREVDYLAENVGASPVQHYWSLAVEEQFYLVWPILIAVLVAMFRTRRRTALLAGIFAVSAASFAFTLHYTVVQPGLAFFVSTTRIWELGVGALLAIAYPRLALLPGGVRSLLGWVGLALIAVAVLTYDSATVWPGTATLLPVLGTAAAVLAGAGGRDRRGPGRLLGLRPAVWVGGLSYSLYLWHWPFLVAAEGLWGHLQVRYTLLIVLASAVPAWLSYRYVEDPLRRSPRLARPRPALLMGAAGTVVASAAGLAAVASFALVDTVELASTEEAPGARVLAGGGDETDWAAVESVDRLRPSPLKASKDLPAIYATECVVGIEEHDFRACEFAAAGSERTVVLVGDSKAVQWFTPVESIAEKAGWRLVVIAKNGCSFADVVQMVGDRPNSSCQEWGPQALATIEEMRPDVVLTVTRSPGSIPEGGTSRDDRSLEPMVAGLVTYWERVLATGARLVPILDTPGRQGGEVAECVQENLERLTACNYGREEALGRSGAVAQLEAAARVPEARVVDMWDVLCPDGATCPPVIGNVLVYRSGTHISDSFAESTEAVLAERLARATDGLLGATAADRP